MVNAGNIPDKGKRSVQVLVLSDIHLGAYGSRAQEVLDYLNTVSPEMLILNGDIVDIWQFRKKHWTPVHTQVIQKFLDLLAQDIPVIYIPGNHDEDLRKFVGLQLGSLSIQNKWVLTLDQKKFWIFHGDAFDVVMKHSKWLARLGATGYALLIWINRLVNGLLALFGQGKISLSGRIKAGVKRAVKFMNHFEQTVADLAIEQGFDGVICGHIHQPKISTIKGKGGEVQYLNSGDWMESLTALEYQEGAWRLYRHATK